MGKKHEWKMNYYKANKSKNSYSPPPGGVNRGGGGEKVTFCDLANITMQESERIFWIIPTWGRTKGGKVTFYYCVNTTMQDVYKWTNWSADFKSYF